MHQFIVDKAPQLFKLDKKSKDKSTVPLKSHDEGNCFYFLLFFILELAGKKISLFQETSH